MKRKDKPRWKELPFYERFAMRLKQRGYSNELCEHIRERGKLKESQENVNEKETTRGGASSVR